MIRDIGRTRLAVDVCIAILFAFSFGLIFLHAAGLAGLLVAGFLALALAIRRLSPGLALLVAWVGALFQMGSTLDVLVSDVAILAVLFATGAYGGRIVRWLGLASAGVGAVIAAGYITVLLPFARGEAVTETPTALAVVLISYLAVLGLSWTLGFLLRTALAGSEARRMEDAARRDAELAGRAVVIEQERNRIARDMHDVVAHSLAVIIAQADGARYAAAADPAAATTALSTISSTARGALGDVRVLLGELRHSQGDTAQPALDRLADLYGPLREAGLELEVTATGTPVALGAGHEIAAYRIVQEGLTNALRHGEPGGSVLLRLAHSAEGLTITIANPTVTDVAAQIGHGIVGMRERAALAGGTLATTVEDGAFVVTAFVPVTAAS